MLTFFQKETRHHTEIEEGVSYVTGNMLWALYQFTVFIVLLSILRARMVNTYHRIFKEADIQWKFFRWHQIFFLGSEEI